MYIENTISTRTENILRSRYVINATNQPIALSPVTSDTSGNTSYLSGSFFQTVNLNNTPTQILSFQNYPPGFYYLMVFSPQQDTTAPFAIASVVLLQNGQVQILDFLLNNLNNTLIYQLGGNSILSLNTFLNITYTVNVQLQRLS